MKSGVSARVVTGLSFSPFCPFWRLSTLSTKSYARVSIHFLPCRLQVIVDLLSVMVHDVPIVP